jgi:hypothetical protein
MFGRWLTQMTRMLWPLGFGRPSAPPTEAVHGSSRSSASASPEAEPPARHTEIPPEQQPGGGAPHR